MQKTKSHGNIFPEFSQVYLLYIQLPSIERASVYMHLRLVNGIALILELYLPPLLRTQISDSVKSGSNFYSNVHFTA